MRSSFTFLAAVLCTCSIATHVAGQGTICPMPAGNTLCQQLQTQRCQTTNPTTKCQPNSVIYDPSLPNHIRVLDCSCYDVNICGPITISGNTASCSGFCPVPPQGNVCQVLANGNPTNQTSVDITTFPAGTQFACSCAPTVQVCGPNTAGTGCLPVQCPIPGQICQPTCVEIDFQGIMHVTKCDCGPDTACHIVNDAVGLHCVGSCPQGMICIERISATPTGTEHCCLCVDDPPACVPKSDGSACVPFHCPITNEVCTPRCVNWSPATGQVTVIDCDCRGQTECHPVFSGGAIPNCQGNCPPGQNCVQNAVQNPDGTITICCDCASEPCRCPGDVNGDNVINGADIAGFVRCFLGAPQPGDNCGCVDLDGNGIYTQADVALFVQYILTKVPCDNTPCCPKADLTVNLATGVDDNNNLIPIGSPDDNWITTVDASGGCTNCPPTVVTPHPAWLTIPGTRWVSANYFGPNGTYEYQYCFCLDPRFKNPFLTLQIRADDAGQVYLNGNFLGNAASFGAASPATLSTSNPAFFHAGQNCVKVVVQNIGGAPTGFNMAGTVTSRDGKCCCDPADLNKNINSGIFDNGGGNIPVGSNDDTYTVTVDASGGSTPRPATVVTPHPLWATIPGTQWISANYNGPNGLYIYQYCFCLDPRFSNAVLTLDVLADDSATIWLNGTQIGATPNGWAFLNPPTHIVVTNQLLFKPCDNCIEFRVINGGGPPTGLDVAGTITATNGLCCNDRQLSCCLSDGNCIDLAPGVHSCPGGGTLNIGPCQNSRPCCLPNGGCQNLDPRCCERAGGTVLPAGTTCDGHIQACCIQHASGGSTCVMADPACCTNIYGGVAMAPGTTCVDSNGDGIADICQPPPPQCGPDPTTGLCRQVQCPSPPAGQQCMPVCVKIDPATHQVIQVLDCVCMDPNSCHIQLSPPPTTATCVGSCPPGFTCNTTLFTNPDGTQTMCCQCQPTVTLCPLPTDVGSQLCQSLQSTQCQTNPGTNNQCRPKVIITHGPGTVPTAEQCSCFDGTACGPLAVIINAQGHYIASCAGPCPPQSGCNVFVNGSAVGPSVDLTTLQPNSTVRCGCFIP